MRQRNYKILLPGLACAVAFAAVLLLGSSAAYCQTRPAPSNTDEKRSKSDKDDLGSDIGSHEREMRAKLALRAEKSFTTKTWRARKRLRRLLPNYSTRITRRNPSAPKTSKKLERIEKLTRRIRNEAGGTDTDIEIEVSPVIETAMKSVADMAEELRKEVEKTPRHVISTTVIDQANKLIGLIQHVRDLNR